MTNSTASSNGNGQALAHRTASVSEEAGELMKPPPWLQAMRDAMTDAVQANDLKEIMAVQVKKAKEGDPRAFALVMNHAHKMLQSEQKRVTIVQNNYYDTPADVRPEVPIAPGDSNGKDVLKMRARARAGVPITGHAGDQRVRPVSDEEEKELRRRQQALEEDEAGDPLRD